MLREDTQLDTFPFLSDATLIEKFDWAFKNSGDPPSEAELDTVRVLRPEAFAQVWHPDIEAAAINRILHSNDTYAAELEYKQIVQNQAQQTGELPHMFVRRLSISIFLM